MAYWADARGPAGGRGPAAAGPAIRYGSTVWRTGQTQGAPRVEGGPAIQQNFFYDFFPTFDKQKKVIQFLGGTDGGPSITCARGPADC
jgi:hypothetical protein